MAIKKNRSVAVEERDKKIEQLDLEELKRYLCMKNYQQPEKCYSCQGLKNCKAGQRAVVLLNEIAIKKEKAQKIEPAKATEPVEKKTRRTKVDVVAETRNLFNEACEQKDPITFVMEKGKIGRTKALQRLRYYTKRYPDIAEKHDIMKRLDSMTMRRAPAHRDYIDTLVTAAIARYREAAAQPDPIAFMQEKYGIDRKKALHNFGQWRLRYGKIESAKEEQTVAEPTKETCKDEENVSVDEFLNEVLNTAKPTAEATEPEPPEDITEEPVKNELQVTATFDLNAELQAKWKKLEQEKEKIADRLKWIDKAQEALIMTMNLFNPESVIGKDLLGE